MNFKKGDKVRFLNDVGGGTVVRILENKMIEVLTEDDFEIPVLASDLVKVSSAENKAFAQEPETVKPQKMQEPEQWEQEDESINQVVYVEGNDDLNLSLALVQSVEGQKSASGVDLYLINDSNWQAQTLLFESFPNKQLLVFNSLLESNSKVWIKHFPEKDLSQFPSLTVQSLVYHIDPHQSHPAVSKEIAINPLKLLRSKGFVENDFFESEALIIPFHLPDPSPKEAYVKSEENLKQLLEDKLNNPRSTKNDNETEKLPELFEVDLHIHELVDDFKYLSNTEMVEIQMKTFHSRLNAALKQHQVKKMVFIHGVGAGVLKKEIHKALSTTYPQLYFQDASFKEYGFGATMIIIRRG